MKELLEQYLMPSTVDFDLPALRLFWRGRQSPTNRDRIRVIEVALMSPSPFRYGIYNQMVWFPKPARIVMSHEDFSMTRTSPEEILSILYEMYPDLELSVKEEGKTTLFIFEQGVRQQHLYSIVVAVQSVLQRRRFYES